MRKDDKNWAPTLHLGHDKLKQQKVWVYRNMAREQKVESEGEKRLSMKDGRMKLLRNICCCCWRCEL